MFEKAGLFKVGDRVRFKGEMERYQIIGIDFKNWESCCFLLSSLENEGLVYTNDEAIVKVDMSFEERLF